MPMLFEIHRPRTLENVIGQPKAVSVVTRFIVGRNIGGRAFWLSGPSGSGKTTLARIIGESIADEMHVEEMVADELTAERVRDIRSSMTLSAFGKGGRAYIVNEAHGLRADTIRRLLDVLEGIPGHVCFIFTTTKDGLETLADGQIDAAPLLSRCIRIALTNQGCAGPYAARVMAIAEGEGLSAPDRTIKDYIVLAKEHKNNIRAMLTAVEAGCMLAA